MITPKTTIKTTRGHTIRIDEFFNLGRQGQVGKAIDLDTGEILAAKLFHPDFATRDTATRTTYLCNQKLEAMCPVLIAPLDAIDDNGTVGYTMRLVDGIPLDEYIEQSSSGFIQNLVLLILLAEALTSLHERGISHGDIRSANVLVSMATPTPLIYIIDFDNFSAPGLPPPTCLGDKWYLAHELYEAMVAQKHVPPNIETDRYSFRIMAEEILMRRHPSAGFQEPVEALQKAMYKEWQHDPARPPVAGVGGYPPGILNARLANLFRHGMSSTPAKRPTIKEWLDALWLALNEVHLCERDGCGCPCLADASKTCCPRCGAPFPALTLVLPDGRRIRLDSGALQIGRNNFAGSQAVSTFHAIIRKIGPATVLESHGRNGTWRKTIDGWERFADKQPIAIAAGDVLRFADITVKIEP